MEERIIDDPRKIKIKRDSLGGIEDATDALAPESGAEEGSEEEEIVVELPEEYDEDLVGLAPSQLEKELERRKKEAEEAKAERDKLLARGEELLAAKEFTEAEPFFSQALLYDPGCERASRALWVCRTENFTKLDVLFDREVAEEFSEADETVKATVRERLGKEIEDERRALEEEAAPLREKVLSARKERRSAFLANRNYYRVRLLVFAAIFFAFVIAMSICGSQIVHVRDNMPLYLTIAFGALALLDLIPIVFLSRKFVVAQRLVRENERPDSTEDGARLAAVEERLGLLALLLG